jgi:hypothetical protein
LHSTTMPRHASLPLTYHPVPCIAWVRASAPALDPLRASSA